jgi:hypothetical protein
MRWWNWIPRRFSLRLLLLAMVSLAVFFAWYGNRKRAIKQERERLAGTWRLVILNGSSYSPENIDLTFVVDDGTIVYPSRSGTGRIDFLLPDGKGGKKVSRAIYRFEKNGTILFAQNGEEKPRPSDFDSKNCDSLFIVRPNVTR